MFSCSCQKWAARNNSLRTPLPVCGWHRAKSPHFIYLSCWMSAVIVLDTWSFLVPRQHFLWCNELSAAGDRRKGQGNDIPQLWWITRWQEGYNPSSVPYAEMSTQFSYINWFNYHRDQYTWNNMGVMCYWYPVYIGHIGLVHPFLTIIMCCWIINLFTDLSLLATMATIKYVLIKGHVFK